MDHWRQHCSVSDTIVYASPRVPSRLPDLTASTLLVPLNTWPLSQQRRRMIARGVLLLYVPVCKSISPALFVTFNLNCKTVELCIYRGYRVMIYHQTYV